MTLDPRPIADVLRGLAFLARRDLVALVRPVVEAVAVDVRSDSATLQVTVSRDAIQQGDSAAQRR